MKFTQIPSDTFSHLQLNAGIVVDGFTPSSGTVGTLLGATSGGISFNAEQNFTDRGDSIDNTPNNTKELKKLNYYTATLSGTFKTLTASLAKQLVGAADNTSGHIVPRHELTDADFDDVWWVGDYSDKNGDVNGGFIAIHLMNALNTNGFQLTSNDENDGDFPFSFMAHYSIDSPDTVPFELYIQEGSAEPQGA